MYRASALLLLAVLAVPAVPAMAADENMDSEYRSWCSRRADNERIAASEREDYVHECMASLGEVDRNPKLAKGKRKRGSDDDG